MTFRYCIVLFCSFMISKQYAMEIVPQCCIENEKTKKIAKNFIQGLYKSKVLIHEVLDLNSKKDPEYHFSELDRIALENGIKYLDSMYCLVSMMPIKVYGQLFYYKDYLTDLYSDCFKSLHEKGQIDEVFLFAVQKANGNIDDILNQSEKQIKKYHVYKFSKLLLQSNTVIKKILLQNKKMLAQNRFSETESCVLQAFIYSQCFYHNRVMSNFCIVYDQVESYYKVINKTREIWVNHFNGEKIYDDRIDELKKIRKKSFKLLEKLNDQKQIIDSLPKKCSL